MKLLDQLREPETMNLFLSAYADGRPYRAPRSAFDSTPGPFLAPRAMATVALSASVGWPGFWDLVQAQLREKAFQRGTLRTYRQVLRSFRKHMDETTPAGPPRPRKPADTSRANVRGFIDALVARQVSWSWQSTCVAVLRTTFDKLAGLSVTAGLCTPKRPIRLGDILPFVAQDRLWRSLSEVGLPCAAPAATPAVPPDRARKGPFPPDPFPLWGETEGSA